MTTIRIDKDVPISEYYHALYKKRGVGKTGRPSKYPFRDMLPGDSFVVPKPQTQDISDFRMTANVYGRRYNMSFLVIRDDTHVYRCWRIA